MRRDNLITQEARGHAALDRYRPPVLGHECSREEFKRLAANGAHELALAMLHGVRVDDVPNRHAREVVIGIPERGGPRSVHELEGAIRANALDHVRRVLDRRFVALFALDEPEIGGRWVLLAHNSLPDEVSG